MDVKSGKVYDDRDAAIKAGADPKDLIELSWQNDRQRDALMLAARHGSRKQRRARRFRPYLLTTGLQVATPAWSRSEKDARNAKNRVARKQRKTNKRKGK